MNITLKQLIPALISFGVSADHIEAAINELRGLLAELDEVEVKGRANVDKLLGCMMALDIIIGKEDGNG